MNTDEKVELVGKAARVVKALEEQHTKLMTQVPRWRPYPEIGTLGVEAKVGRSRQRAWALSSPSLEGRCLRRDWDAWSTCSR